MLLLIAMFLAATIEAFRGPNGIKNFSVRRSAFQNFLSSNDDIEIEKSLRELLRCEQSFNPIDRWRVPGLREKIRQLEMSREKDSKEIMLLTADENFLELHVQITRKMLNDWSMSGRLLVSTENPSVTYTANNFADIIELNTFALVNAGSLPNLDGYLRTEADIQTRDCINAILKGQFYLPPFSNSSDTITTSEFTINLPRSLNQSEYGMTFPIVPDAVLIHGSHWLILESKHKALNTHLKKLDRIGRFVQEYGDEKWVKKKYERPTEVTLVMNSIGDYSEQVLDDSSVHLVIRDGLSYKKLN